MDLDPDIAVPSIERNEEVVTAATPKRGDTLAIRNVSSSTDNSRLESSPSRTPLKTSRARQHTPGPTYSTRSPSTSSMRNGASTPTLDKKRSIPNLAVPQSTTPVHQPQFRRASSNLNPLTPTRMKSLEREKHTPATVAQDYFRKELNAHSGINSEVIVYTHDSCYGHRFSRPRSSKATLASIVERPERIHAALLGTSTAYIRLGERHKDGRYGPSLDYDPNTIPTTPFTIRKTTRSVPLNHSAVTSVHGTKWMEGLQIMCDTAEANLAMGRKELTRPLSHSKDTRGNTLPPLHSGDLYLASESLAALQGCLGGVFDAVDTVFQSEVTRRVFVCIRPPGHHCSADMPSGFCWLNNVHVGISYAAMHHGLTHAAIIDFDLHHGDGSQSITWQHNQNANTALNPKSIPSHKKMPIGYYSLHDINSYPCEYGDDEKVRNASTCLHTAHGQSIWNVHLESWRSHADFWDLYKSKYSVLLEKAQAFLRYHSEQLRQSGIQPKAAIFLSSGFDASEWESEGMQRHQVNVPTGFYAKFTQDVVAVANQPDLGVDGRVISVLEGGYSDRALASGVLSHLCGLTHPTKSTREQDVNPIASLGSHASENMVFNASTYDPSWWCREHLESLEAMVTGNLPLPASKPKDKPLNNYTSPTQASSAKMTEFAKERVSISAQIEARLQLESAPIEPTPEVDWITAAYELSRLLIPEDRQTLSCTHEDLNAENSRARRDRQSLALATPTDLPDEKMNLRDRKAKPTNLGVALPRAAVRSTSRRTTIAAASDLPDPSAVEAPRTRRRSSASSSVLSSFQELRLEERSNDLNSRNLARSGSDIHVQPPAPVPARKTRTPATRKPPSVTSSPRKGRATKETSTILSSDAKPIVDSTVTSAHEQPTDQTFNGSRQNSVEELTNGMQKISIKLKLPVKGEHNDNIKPLQEPSKPKPRATRKPPVPKVGIARAATANGGRPASSEKKRIEVPPALPPVSHTSATPTTSTTVSSNPAAASDRTPPATDTLANERAVQAENIKQIDHEMILDNRIGHGDRVADIRGNIRAASLDQAPLSPKKEESPASIPFATNILPIGASQSSYVPENPRFDKGMEQSVMYPTINLRSESTSSSFNDSAKDNTWQ